MLRAKQVLSYVEQALAGAVSPEIEPLELVNQAGRFLFSLHPWKFKQTRQALLDLRAPITLTGATWIEASKTLRKTGAFATYKFLAGDEITITAGTSATVGAYKLASRTNDDDIVLEESIGSAADGKTDIAGSMTMDSVALPDDFEALNPAHGIAGRQTANVYGFRLCTLEELLIYRTRQVTNPSPQSFHGAISSGFTKELPPRPILEIDPPSSQAVSGAFLISYRAGFPSVTSDNDVVRIPEHMELFFLQVARAVAQGYEEADNKSMANRLAELTADVDLRTGGKTLFHFAKMQDGAVQPSYGRPIAPGALMRSSNTWNMPPFQPPTPTPP